MLEPNPVALGNGFCWKHPCRLRRLCVAPLGSSGSQNVSWHIFPQELCCDLKPEMSFGRSNKNGLHEDFWRNHQGAKNRVFDSCGSFKLFLADRRPCLVLKRFACCCHGATPLDLKFWEVEPVSWHNGQWPKRSKFKPFSKFQMMDSGTLLNIMIYKIKIQNRTIICKLKYFFHHVWNLKSQYISYEIKNQQIMKLNL